MNDELIFKGNALLEHAGQHYALVLANKGYNDPQTIRARAYVNTSFGADGHAMIKSIDAAWESRGNTESEKPKQGKLKSFVHPLKAKPGELKPADTPVNTSGKKTQNTGTTTQPKKDVAGNFSELDELKFRRGDLLTRISEAPEDERSGETWDELNRELDSVAEKIWNMEQEMSENESDNKATQNADAPALPLTDEEKAEIVTLTPAVARNQYGYDRIEATIKALNIPIAPGMNERQIAGALIAHLKKGGK